MRLGLGLAHLAPAQRVEMHREELAQHLGRRTLGHAQHLGLVMVTGDQPPQRALDDDRDRHRGGDAHIAQIFAMHRRHAAQMRIGQIQRLAQRALHRHHRHRGIVHIADHPDRVAQIQRPRLLRNVAGREILATKAFQPLVAGLAHHLAGAVRPQLIDHHPVITQLCLHQCRRMPDQPLGVVDQPQPAQHGAGDPHDIGGPGGVLSLRLEFKDHMLVEMMRAEVEEPAVHLDAKDQRRPGTGADHGQRIADPVALFGTQNLAQRHAVRIACQPQHGRSIGRMALHHPPGIVAGQQTAMRLDAAGNMDRLAVAIGQVDRATRQRGIRDRVEGHAAASSP